MVSDKTSQKAFSVNTTKPNRDFFSSLLHTKTILWLCVCVCVCVCVACFLSWQCVLGTLSDDALFKCSPGRASLCGVVWGVQVSGSVLRHCACVLRHGFGHAVPLFRDSVYMFGMHSTVQVKKNKHNILMYTNVEYTLEFNSFKALLWLYILFVKIKIKHYDEKRKYRKEYTKIHLTSGVHVFCNL